MESRYNRLRRIFDLYDTFCRGLERFCRKGCSLCCTANVTVTGLEAELILDFWRAKKQALPMAALKTTACQGRFRPTVTINRLAEMCARGEDGPDEEADPQAGPCPLLKGDLCSIYAVRPFGCRAMQSLSDCRRLGAADMPEWLFSANTLFLQYIEAADRPGITGNLTDVLLFLAEREKFVPDVEFLRPPACLPANHSITALMIPPEHRGRLQGPARALREIVADPGPLA